MYEEPTSNPFLPSAKPLVTIQVHAPANSNQNSIQQQPVEPISVPAPNASTVPVTTNAGSQNQQVIDWQPKSAASVKITCLGRCGKICNLGHEKIVKSTVLFSIFLGITILFTFGVFIYSLMLLKPYVSIGTSCTPPSSQFSDVCSSPLNSISMMCGSLQCSSCSCANICTNSQFSSISPFLFTIPSILTRNNITTASSFSFSNPHDYIYCPFPYVDSTWRITLTFFTSLLGLLSFFIIWKGYKLLLLFATLCMLTASGMFFYVMVIDSTSVNNSVNACVNNFPSWTLPTSWGSKVSCFYAPLIAIPILDATCFVITFYTALVFYGKWKILRAIASEEPQVEARRVALEASFSRPEGEGGSGDENGLPDPDAVRRIQESNRETMLRQQQEDAEARLAFRSNKE
jgi:hypothetical protein